MHVVLVGIDADAELAGVRRGLQHADAGAAGGVIDDVGAAIELRFGELAALHRIVPGGAGRAGHVLEHLGVRLHRLDAADIAAGELADERNVHAADEADLAGLRRQRGEHADEVAALLFLEHDGGDVRLVDDHVDDGELGVRELGCDLLDRLGLARSRRRRSGYEAALGEVAQRLLALAVVLDLEIADTRCRCPS